MHLHRNEEEHFIVISGLYRVAHEDKVFDISSGASITIPKGARHSWRNLSSEPSHLLVVLTPGGFERCIQTIRNYLPEKLEEIAASFGCYIVGPPVSA
jgi:mannose-6-phosphate isomerase-like protein (cupin superfamily)